MTGSAPERSRLESRERRRELLEAGGLPRERSRHRLSRLLYIDCIAGTAGDMLLAALLHAGASPERVNAGLRTVPGSTIEVAVSRTARHEISAAQVEVIAPPQREHRTWDDVRELVDGADLPERARTLAHEAFRRLAEAEARVHGTDPDEVRFHEVGALDAVADICGVALAVEDLSIERVVSSPVPAPRGLADGSHGRMPLPPPATLELLKGARAPLYGVDLDVELVTPTGAALLATLADEFGPLPEMRLEAIGYGAGTRDMKEVPNLVRVLVGEQVAGRASAPVSLIETNLDDFSPELVPDAAEACFAAGALDVWATPVQMKKGRPGVVLSALARPADEGRVAEALLRETSALGVRIAQLRRWELDRDEHTVDVRGEQVRVKVGMLDGEVINVAPEHDDCVAVATRTGQTVKSVWAAAFAAGTRGNQGG
jgi:pyridinium-3,5-bisthiocarboxylic acid mononucleotide nickel chelatase